jgi:hypothetical protein
MSKRTLPRASEVVVDGRELSTPPFGSAASDDAPRADFDWHAEPPKRSPRLSEADFEPMGVEVDAPSPASAGGGASVSVTRTPPDLAAIDRAHDETAQHSFACEASTACGSNLGPCTPADDTTPPASAGGGGSTPDESIASGPVDAEWLARMHATVSRQHARRGRRRGCRAGGGARQHGRGGAARDAASGRAGRERG